MVRLLEISVEVDGEAAEAVSTILGKHAQGGAILEQEWPEHALQPRHIKVKAFLSDEHLSSLPHIKEALWHLGQLYPIPPLSVRWLSETDWAEAWKSDLTIQHIGHRIVIKPSWLRYTPGPDEAVVELDPGLAFGTGLHPSTHLCLVALDDYLQPGDQVLDVGTGSGILSIAAARLGAHRVIALDVDGVALQVAQENITCNGVQTAISLHRASLSPLSTGATTIDPVEIFNAHGILDGTFDMLLMNILPEVIAKSARPIAACLSTKGLFVVSGIIRPRENLVERALSAAHLTITDRRDNGDWVALIGRKEGERSGIG